MTVKTVMNIYCDESCHASKPTFEGAPVTARREPLYDGKTGAFWHITSQGDIEEERIPNMRRCERIRWPKAFIEHADMVKAWRNTRSGEKNVCLWLEEENYLVVLGERPGYFLLRTAYFVEYEHTRRKLRKEYEAYMADAAKLRKG